MAQVCLKWVCLFGFQTHAQDQTEQGTQTDNFEHEKEMVRLTHETYYLSERLRR